MFSFCFTIPVFSIISCQNSSLLSIFLLLVHIFSFIFCYSSCIRSSIHGSTSRFLFPAFLSSSISCPQREDFLHIYFLFFVSLHFLLPIFFSLSVSYFSLFVVFLFPISHVLQCIIFSSLFSNFLFPSSFHSLPIC